MTDQPYDLFDYETWPDEQKDFVGRVRNGLGDGNLQPLADYLRAGHYIFPNLASVIADYIEGKDVPFRIITKGAKPGQKGMKKTIAEDHRNMRIGVFMEAQVRQNGKGGYEAALSTTRKRFAPAGKEELGKATVEKHHKRVRDQIKAGSFPGYDLFDVLLENYPTHSD
jgi:hypothetical protein